jgi:hypothetical protein
MQEANSARCSIPLGVTRKRVGEVRVIAHIEGRNVQIQDLRVSFFAWFK